MQQQTLNHSTSSDSSDLSDAREDLKFLITNLFHPPIYQLQVNMPVCTVASKSEVNNTYYRS